MNSELFNNIEKIYNIPGQIEEDEVKNLIFQANKCKIEKDEIVVEIGSLFGKSTLAIIKGLESNPSKFKQLYVYDKFYLKEQKNNPYYTKKYMLNWLAKSNLHNALIIKKNVIDFENIYRFHTYKYEGKILKTFRTSFTKIKPIKHKIALLHIDAAKDIEGYIKILNKFSNNLRKGSIILFQDYFFENIDQYYLIEILLQKKILEYNGFSKTTLVAKLKREIKKKDLLNIMQTFKTNKSKYIFQSFKRNELLFKEYNIDKFFTQAVATHFFFLSNKEFKKSDYIYKKYINQYFEINKSLNHLITSKYKNLINKNLKNITIK